MHTQPLAQHLEETQRQIASLKQHANALYPQHRASVARIFSTLAAAIDELRQIDRSANNGADGAVASVKAAETAASVELHDRSLPTTILDDGEYLRQAGAEWETDQALQHQLQITRTITDNATACLFMMDTEGRCTFMNPAAEQVTGYSFAEVQGQILHDMIHHTHPDGRPYPKDECPLDRALPQNNQIRAHEDIFVRKDGTFFPVVCAASPIVRDGVPVGTVIEVRDITENKLVEQERAWLFEAEQNAVSKARLQAEQLRGLTEASIAINAALSINEVLHLITEQARHLIGAHQAVSGLRAGEDWSQAISTVSFSDKYSAWRDYNTQPDGSGIYAEICRLNIPVCMTQEELEAHPAWRGFGAHASEHPPMRGWLAAPFIGRDGQNIGLLQLSDKYSGDFTLEDQVILVQLAQMASVALENARLYTAAQEAIRARNEFLSVASHELNTPVTSLRGYSQLLSRQIDKGQIVDRERATRALKAIEQQSIKLGQLINQLLDISRIESGRLILNRQPADITSLIQEVAANLQATTSRHELVVLAPGPLIASVDPLRIEQVLINLIGNAIKYSPEGGPVIIELSQPTGETLEISVTDQGIGVPPEHRPHIFNRFYQAHGSGYFGGMGLGLSISQQIVALHGGELQAKFPAAGGTRFVIQLPHERAQALA